MFGGVSDFLAFLGELEDSFHTLLEKNSEIILLHRIR